MIITGKDGSRWYQHPGSGRISLLGKDREPDPAPKIVAKPKNAQPPIKSLFP